MTPIELKMRATHLYGAARWQTALAQEMAVNSRTVRRWAAGDSPVPASVATCLRLMTFLDELRWLGEWRSLVAEELGQGGLLG
jgi:hypothetical protein